MSFLDGTRRRPFEFNFFSFYFSKRKKQTQRYSALHSGGGCVITRPHSISFLFFFSHDDAAIVLAFANAQGFADGHHERSTNVAGYSRQLKAVRKYIFSLQIIRKTETKLSLSCLVRFRHVSFATFSLFLF
jgi:hypothetical protein